MRRTTLRVLAVLVIAGFGCVSSLREVESVKIEFQLVRPDYAYIERLLDSARVKAPASSEVDFWYGRLYQATDRLAEAWKSYQAAMKKGMPREKMATELDRLFVDLFNRGQARMGKGETEGAVADLILCAEVSPDRYEPFAVLGYLYSSTDQAKSIEMYRKAYTLEPTDVETAEGYGTVLLSSQKCAEAVDVFRAVVKLHPDTAQTKSKLRLAAALTCAGRQSEALAILEELERVSPGNVGILFDIATYAFNDRDYAKAITYYERVLAIDPNDKEALLWLAESHRGTGDVDKTMSTYERLIVVDPGNAAAYFELGKLYQQVKGDQPKALEMYTQALTLDPNMFEAAFFGGLAAVQADQLDRAIVMLENASRIQPTNCEVWEYLANLYAKKKMTAERDAAYEKYRSLNCQ